MALRIWGSFSRGFLVPIVTDEKQRGATTLAKYDRMLIYKLSMGNILLEREPRGTEYRIDQN